MADHRYGYKTPAEAYDPNERLKLIDRALRAEILQNARRQYEAAARSLILKTQSEVQAKAKAKAKAIAQAQAHAQVRAHLQAQAQAQAQAEAEAKAQVQAHAQAYAYARAPIQYSPIETAAHRPISSSSSSTRRTPESIPSANHVPFSRPSSTSSKPTDGNALGLDELKRRYYAQLSNNWDKPKYPQYTSQSRQHGSNAISGNMNVQHTRISSPGPIRTMADEYLDFHMPARRGPQSNHGENSKRQEASRWSSRGKSPEVTNFPGCDDRHERCCHHQSSVPGTSVNRADHEQPPLRSVRFQPASESSTPPKSSKRNLSFLLNPYKPDAPKPSPIPTDQNGPSQSPISNRRTADESPSENSSSGNKRHAIAEYPGSSHVDEEPPRRQYMLRNTSSMSSRRYAVRRSPSKDSEKDQETRRLNLRSSSSSAEAKQHSDESSKSVVKHAPPERLRASYSRSAKRKASSEPPNSPAPSDASTDEGAPRAKRRAFGRLPVDYDSQSESSPESEDT